MLKFNRLNHTTGSPSPFDDVQWELRTASIGNERGEVVFEQSDVEIPAAWSQMATNVVVSKYFRGKPGTPEREHSVKQLIGRVADTITTWGISGGYFATDEDAEAFRDELTYLLLHQQMAFNSPVWFNVGVEAKPQASACFINSVEDTMESIMDLAKTESMLFKWGSGAGCNLSPLRSSKEHLAGGGTASGPVSFMRGFDSFAGAVKSGGKTRRAAKMVILNIDHPDVEDFITCKAAEERKAHALIDAGYDGGFNVPGGAYDSVAFQNANHSVRVSNEFMRAVEDDAAWGLRGVCDGEVKAETKARDLMMKMCEAAWFCGDPGIQYDTTINDWHTCIATDRIHASNPCVTGDTLVSTANGWIRIDQLLDTMFSVVGADGQLHEVKPAFKTGHKPVYKLTTKAGFELTLTADHLVTTKNRGDVKACELTVDDVLVLGGYAFGQRSLDEGFAEYVGLMLGDGCVSKGERQAILTLNLDDQAVADRALAVVRAWREAHANGDGRTTRDINVTQPQQTLRLATGAACVVDELCKWAVLDEGSTGKRLSPQAMQLDARSTAALLRGLFTTDGTVANYADKSQYVGLDSTSEEMLRQVQLLLLGFGIKSKLYRNRRPMGQTTCMMPDGQGGVKEYAVEQMHSLRISRKSRVLFEERVGFAEGSAKREALRQLNTSVKAYAEAMTDRLASITPVGMQDVYDLTEPVTSHFVANGLVVHNCSEFKFLNNTACNLASLNLMHFVNSDFSFDVERFKHAVRVTITAQEIIVGNAGYPTPLIERNSHEFRPLGLGYANLGALLMVSGLPYDSDQGRDYAAAITSLMCAEAYRQSAEIAQGLGAFKGYEVNREPMLHVIRKHTKAAEKLKASAVANAAFDAWLEAHQLGQKVGYRNSQVTVLAPTGTIAFMMDCDTTGIEPDIALIKYKKLVGGGYFKIVNQAVPAALERLGYDKAQQGEVIDYLMEHETIEGAPHVKDEHLPVFDCAFKAKNGVRTITPMGHLKMMAAAQPFLSGAISKTVNMPADATVEDIFNVYMEAWKMGLKAVAIYRDGCKRTQPLNTSGEATAQDKASAIPVVAGQRRRLADERPSLTHKFSINGHEGYITVGMYPDGQPGEVFVTMSKQGSTINGLMDALATTVSIGLQHGVPLALLVDKLKFTSFEPSGFTSNPDIRMAKSVTDYLFRWLEQRFILNEVAPMPITAPSAVRSVTTAPKVSNSDAPPCSACGNMTVRSGTCYVCQTCGTTTGCG